VDGLRLLDPRRGASRDPGALRELLRRAGLGGQPPRIRCPRCRWEPRRESLWACGCGAAWNTFDTRALCPGCGHRWEHTRCHACHRWSRHEDWYERDGGGPPA